MSKAWKVRMDQCISCGVPFLRRAARTQRCDECRVAHRRAKEQCPERRIKINAQRAAQAAVARGDLVRETCEWLNGDSRAPSRCGRPSSHAHHEDYSRPLDVRWLCPLHHRWRHGMTAEEPRWRLMGRELSAEAAQ